MVAVRRMRCVVGGLLFVVGTIGIDAGPVGAEVDRVDAVSGGADGIQGNVTPSLPAPPPPAVPIPLPPVVISPTPSVSLPAGGGSVSDSALNVGQPGAVEVDVLHVQSSGGGVGTPDGFAESSAAAAGVDVGGGAIAAGVLQSECRSDAGGSTGTTNIAALSAGGNDFPDTAPPPNSGGEIPGVGSLMLNGQQTTQTDSGSSTEVTAFEATIDMVLLQGGLSIATSRCAAGGVALDEGTVPPGDGGSGPSTPGAGPTDDPDLITGLLPRTGPMALGTMLFAGLSLLGLGAVLRRFGSTASAMVG